jgi:hypothetical protein
MRRSPRPRRSVRLLGSIGLAALVVVGLATARLVGAASRERRFFSALKGVGVEAPVGWTLSLHTGYPEILVVLLHPDGSRISLSASPTKLTDAKALAEQSRRGLEAQHLEVTRAAPGPRGGVLVEAHGTGHTAQLRQLYLVRPAGAGKSQAVVVTLATRTETLAAASLAFDWVTAHLVLEAPAGADEASHDAGAPRAGPGDASAPERARAQGGR